MSGIWRCCIVGGRVGRSLTLFVSCRVVFWAYIDKFISAVSFLLVMEHRGNVDPAWWIIRDRGMWERVHEEEKIGV
jgi:hypothetical protein